MPAANLKKGSKGVAVTVLQSLLKVLGLYGGQVDGIFGPRTEDGVRIFQKQHNVLVDGVYGSAIKNLLTAKPTTASVIKGYIMEEGEKYVTDVDAYLASIPSRDFRGAVVHHSADAHFTYKGAATIKSIRNCILAENL